MVLREQNDVLSQSRGIMGPLENSTGVQNNRGRLRQRFDLIRKLGQGTYGKVQLGIDKETGQEVAIKTIKKSKIETEADLIRIQREIQIMSSVRHPNIIHIYEVFENREKMVLVMEYAAGGELYDYLNERKTLQEDEARRIFRQIASAVYYCHKHNICHRDLKLENILLDEKSNAKIADFGLSNVFDDVHLLKTFCGSPLYASPEIVRGTRYYGPEVDCWSLGVLLYTLVYGAMPFDGSNFKRLVKQISNGDYYEPSKKAEASALIRLMLTVDPLKRATIKDVCSNLWINQGFTEQCLIIAEELANQTPVRLDLLLSLAPGASNNPSTTAADKGGEGPSTKPETKLKSKSKRDTEVPDKYPTKEKEANVSKTPNEVKKKQPVKKKSKSSPVLELIVDVEEEKELDLDDDVGDTLSEISEIQTIAEEEPIPKQTPTEKDNLKCPSTSTTAKLIETKDAVKVKEKSPKPPNLTQISPEPMKKEEDAARKGIDIQIPTKEKSPITPKPVPEAKVKKEDVKSVPEINAAESKVQKEIDEKPKEAKVEPTTTKLVKKKVVKPKTPEKERQVETVKPEQETVNLVEKEQEKVSSSGTENESSDNNKPSQRSPSKVKARSDSITGDSTSPTRIERRNSKVISQKTAELIQNLETKTGTSSTPDVAAKGKKLVFPTLKVSDAKSRFENPTTEPSVSVKPGPKPASNSVVDNTLQKFKTQVKPINAPSEKMAEKLEKGKDIAVEVGQGAGKPQTQTVTKVKEDVKPKELGTENKLPKDTIKISLPEKEKSKSKSPVGKSAKTDGQVKSSETVQAPEAVISPKKVAAEKPNLKVKIIPIQPVVEPEQKIPNKVGSSTAPIQKSQQDATPVNSNSRPTPPDSSSTTPVQGKEPFSPKISPQNKEQAAKKIGSVIQRIVSSESVEKGMDEKLFAPEKKGPGSFKTEIQKFVAAASGDTPKTQRTEVRFPVAAASSQERIIPIQLTDEVSNGTANSSRNNSGASINSSFPPRMDSMKSTTSAFSRQNSSDTESSISMASVAPPRMDALKKSPREFIIPIKVESSGHTVTPREDLLNSESSLTEDNFRLDSRLRPGRFGKMKRFNSILSDSSLEDEPISATSSRRSSAATPTAAPSHARSLSQGDEPVTPGTFKRYRRLKSAGLPLDKSDSFSSAEDDDEDTFEVLTAESLFSSLLDRVRNLTKRLNRETSVGQNWNDQPGFGMWGAANPLEFMSSSRTPSEARQFVSSTTPGSFSSSRSYSREPSLTVTISGGPSNWRRSLSRDVSGESDSVLSEAVSRSSSVNARNFSTRPSDSYDTFSTRSATPVTKRPLSYMSPRPQPSTESSALENSFKPGSGSGTTRPAYGRTMSNMDFSTSVTLPFRRPLRTYDHTLSSADYTASPYSSSATSQSSLPLSKDSSTSSYSRSLDPSTRFEPGSPYLGRFRTLNRYSSTPEPDSRRYAGINETLATKSSNPVESEGWIGGSTSSSTRTTAAKMTTQEKMNSYQNYYQSLAQDPLRRHNSVSPSVNPQPFTPAPTVMYETNFLPQSNGPKHNEPLANLVEGQKPKELTKPNQDVSNTSGSEQARLSANPIKPPTPNLDGATPKTYQAQSILGKIQNLDTNEAKTIPKWPTVSVKQHRPVSISNFPDRPFPQELHSAPVTATENNSMNIFRPLSPQSQPTTSFVKAQAERLTSPPPEQDRVPYESKLVVNQTKLRGENTRATSVDKITRFLERKSVPREIPQDKAGGGRVRSPTPVSSPTVVERQSVSPEKNVKSGTGSKISKPKFFQSLEKKWEKFTNKNDESNSGCSTPEPQQNLISNSSDEAIDPGNESMLLQRAVSPERKVKTKFGASTVNFMLGKFRKIEENSFTSPKTLAGKPPSGTGRVGGRRVQSVYAGACSDGVLTLPFPQHNVELEKTRLNISNAIAPTVADFKATLTNIEGQQSAERKSAESPQINHSTLDQCREKSPSKKPKRPLSLGIFSKNGEQSKSSSFIPRFSSRCIALELEPKTKPVIDLPSTPVQPMLKINVDCMPKVNADDNLEDNPLTPSSISDNSSICSERTEVSAKSSILDDEESVSDRILRKSFYTRFNSLDRKTPNSISPNTISTTSGIKRYSPNRSSTSKFNLDSKYSSSSSCLPSSLSPKINKYNPNPLFRELITDDFKSDVGRKTEYSRRVTSKLSKLLRDIESDINICNGATTNSTNCNSENGNSEGKETPGKRLTNGEHRN